MSLQLSLFFIIVIATASQIVYGRYDSYPKFVGSPGADDCTWFSVNEQTKDSDGRAADVTESLLVGLSGSTTATAVSMHHREISSKLLFTSASRITAGKNNITVLDLSANRLSSSSVRAVSALLPRLTSLDVLVFDGNDLSSSESMRAIVAALRKHPSIRRLHLSRCHLNDDSMDTIAHLIRTNRNITHLDLSGNSITEEGLMKLLASAETSSKLLNKKKKTRVTGSAPSLRILDLSYNPLRDEGILRLASTVEFNHFPFLVQLDLKHVGASAGSVERLLQSISHKSLLHHIDLSGNKLIGSPVTKSSKMKKFETMMSKGVKSFEKIMPSAFTGAVKNAAVSLGWSGLTDVNKPQLSIKNEDKPKPRAIPSGKAKGSNRKPGRHGKKSVKKQVKRGKSTESSTKSKEYYLARSIFGALTQTPNLQSIDLANCGLNDRFCSDLYDITSNENEKIDETNSKINYFIDVSLNGLSETAMENVAKSLQIFSSIQKKGK